MTDHKPLKKEEHHKLIEIAENCVRGLPWLSEYPEDMPPNTPRKVLTAISKADEWLKEMGIEIRCASDALRCLLDAKDAEILRLLAFAQETTALSKVRTQALLKTERERDAARADMDTFARAAVKYTQELAAKDEEIERLTLEAEDTDRYIESWHNLHSIYLRELDEARTALENHIATWDPDGWRDQVREARAERDALRTEVQLLNAEIVRLRTTV